MAAVIDTQDGIRPQDVQAPGRRWIQLVLGMVAMMAISSPQYVWALFVMPIKTSLDVSLSALQVTIALFSIFQCGFGPFHGYVASKVTSRQLALAGGFLTGASWVLSSQVTSLPVLYLTYGVLSGIGTGFVYVAVVELMIQWFPDRRGLAIGMVSGSYGFGAIVTTFPIDTMIRGSGYQATLLTFGFILAAVIMLAAIGMARPPLNWLAHHAAKAQIATVGVRSTTTAQMVRTPVFWFMFAAMSMVATGGLMAISQLGAFARDFGITPEVTVMGLAALPLALTVDRFANGLTRPFFGWLSDRVGRENTMFFAFALEGCAIFALLKFGHDPVAFVILTGLVFFGWGEIYSLFPSLQADLFGPKYAAKNFGVLLIATAVGSIFGGPVAALLYEATSSWSVVFYSVIALDFMAALMVILIIKPMSKKWISRPHDRV